MVLLLALVSLMGMPYTVLMPVIGERGAARRAAHAGLSDGRSGVGALSGALYLASRPTVVGLGRVIVATAALFGAGLIAFSVCRVLWLSVALPDGGRLRDDGADGGEQHHPPDDRG